MHERTREGILILGFSTPRITASNGSYTFERAMRDATEHGQLAVAIDMAGVEYLDSSALRVLWSAYRNMICQHGHLCLFHVAPALYEFLDQLVVTEFLEICSDEDEAVARFEDRPKRRRIGSRLWWAFTHAYSFAYSRGLVKNRRREGDRRHINERRERSDRRDMAA